MDLLVSTLALFALLLSGCAHQKISEREWVRRLQTPTGSILLSNDRKTVQPYFANLAVWALLKTQPSKEEITLSEHWIDWYLTHLNGSGPGLAVGGSIFDYEWKDGGEHSTLNYDSLDAYAGTFLMVLNQYYRATQNKEFIDLRMIRILMVIDAIQASIREDLDISKPSDPVSYLMDNVEVWRGLVDFASLMISIGQTQKALEITAIALRIENQIEAKLWVPASKIYLPYVGASANSDSFYPEAVAPLWPILFDLPEAGSRKQTLWLEFKRKFKKQWLTENKDSFSWSFLAYLAIKMGDPKTALEWKEMFLKRENRNWPWHIGESAGYLLIQ